MSMKNYLLQHGGGNVVYIAIVILIFMIASFSIWAVFSIIANTVGILFNASFGILYKLYCISDFGFDMVYVFFTTFVVWCFVCLAGFIVKNIIKLIFK